MGKRKDDPEALRLIYVLRIGDNAAGEGVYEFIFSTTPGDIDECSDWGWFNSPAIGTCRPPGVSNIDKIIRVETEKVVLDALHDSPYFPYIEGYYRVLALAWENLESFNDLDEEYARMVFHYGDTLQQVEDRLYSRDIVFEYAR